MSGPNTADRGLLLEADDSWTVEVSDGYALYIDNRAPASEEFAASVATGLAADTKWLHCRWLYDEAGSAYYEKITEQPEYYLTRVEDRILSCNAAAIRERVGDKSIVELGSGSSSKTRHLLEAWLAAAEARYVPIDISGAALDTACRELADAYPALHVEGIAASYGRGLRLAGGLSPLMLVFLGSTVGNLADTELDELFALVASALRPDDHFLLGIDLVKDPATLEAAYDDAAGWTAKFTTNIFARMNRELGTRIPLDSIDHVARYNEARERIEIYNRFTAPVDIDLGAAGSFHIDAGESVFIEISRKFRVEDVVRRARRFGIALEETYTDEERRFAVLLLRRQQRPT